MISAHHRGLANLPLIVSIGCALLPFLAVHCAFFLAANAGHVDWCNPYVDSCTSISATGRRPPASFVFRGVMLPSAMLMMLYWWLHWFWLGTVSTHARPRHTMLGLGWLACLGLVLYVTVLGEVGDVWRLQRKIGTVLFFSFTFLSQLLLAGMLRDLPGLDLNAKARASAVGGRLLRLCQIMLIIGVLSVLLQLISEGWHDRIEDAIEWQLALLLQLNFLFSAGLWHRSDWHLVFRRDGT
jgi:hypothetical protein